jgi:asparagine synthase (glutamine-hydrolysing)
MCGIAGLVYSQNTDAPDLAPLLEAMANAMHHRGPDDEGFYVAPGNRVGFANRRLAIRDLSPAGHMPMSNAAGTITITYNGEVYNTDELRVELEQLGYGFRSHSDTEVILLGYEQWGSGIVARLRGMFAFAICDQRTAQGGSPKILIARDHLGIKPIYYWQAGGAFAFASELKSLFAAGIVPREIDPSGLVGYLLTGSVPNPLTLYQNVRALEPSTFLTIDPSGEINVQPTQYWSLPVGTVQVASVDDAAEQVRALMAEAVRIRLVSDVPLGAFLSGGLDSSSVVALMRQATNGAIRTCSMVFDEAEFSEAPYARAVAEAVGAEHFERVITFEDVKREFENILTALDQPSVDGVNTYFVSQTARQAGLTVALSGLGGDELFGGYPNTFGSVPRIQRTLALAQSVPGGAAAARAVIHRLPNPARWNRFEAALDRPATLASAYLSRRGLFAPREVQQLVTPDIWQASRHYDAAAHVAMRANAGAHDYENPFAWVSRAELRNYTHDQLLRDTDVMSMIHSLEVRVPLLDRQLVAFALQLSSWVKTLDRAQPKPLLARAMHGLLPETVLQRRDKQGFTFPFALWLREGLDAQVQQALDAVSTSGLLQAHAVAQVRQQFQQRQIHWSRVWALAALAGSVL